MHWKSAIASPLRQVRDDDRLIHLIHLIDAVPCCAVTGAISHGMNVLGMDAVEIYAAHLMHPRCFIHNIDF